MVGNRGISGDMARNDMTRLRLLTAAERLFAQKGIEGTSLREIVVLSGLKNNSSVQYHFGSKEGLISALFQYRMLQMEERRSQMIRQAVKENRTGNLRTLIDIICLPHLDLRDHSGRYLYAEFLAQYLLRYRPPLGVLSIPAEPPAPEHLLHAQSLIRQRLSHLSEGTFVRRLVLAVLDFLTVLTNDRLLGSDRDLPDCLDEALDDSLENAVLALDRAQSGECQRRPQ